MSSPKCKSASICEGDYWDVVPGFVGFAATLAQIKINHYM